MTEQKTLSDNFAHKIKALECRAIDALYNQDLCDDEANHIILECNIAMLNIDQKTKKQVINRDCLYRDYSIRVNDIYYVDIVTVGDLLKKDHDHIIVVYSDTNKTPKLLPKILVSEEYLFIPMPKATWYDKVFDNNKTDLYDIWCKTLMFYVSTGKICDGNIYVPPGNVYMSPWWYFGEVDNNSIRIIIDKCTLIKSN